MKSSFSKIKTRKNGGGSSGKKSSNDKTMKRRSTVSSISYSSNKAKLSSDGAKLSSDGAKLSSNSKKSDYSAISASSARPVSVNLADLKDVKEKLNKGLIRVNEADEDELTYLHRACDGGYVKAALFLIKKGADVNANDSDDQTPLHIACFHENILIIKALMV